MSTKNHSRGDDDVTHTSPKRERVRAFLGAAKTRTRWRFGLVAENTTSMGPMPTSLSRRGLLLGLLLLPMAAVGCGYPEVSREAFELATLIENLCSYKKPEQVEKARALVREKREQNAITDSEQAVLMTILAEAEAGRWSAASEQARELMRTQNRSQ